MPTTQAADVPYWPKVEALVRSDGTGEVTIQGICHPVRAGDVPGAREDVLAIVRSQAAERLGRPVRVDTSDPTGEWQLIVHPDGTVCDADEGDTSREPRPTEPTPDAPDVEQAPLEQAPTMAPLQPADDSGAPTPQAWPGTPPSTAASGPTDTPGTDSTPPALEEHPPTQSDSLGLSTRRPTLDDLISGRPAAPTGPATTGWQAAVRRLTGGLIAPAPGAEELSRRKAVEAVQRSLNGPKTVVVVNPKGGAHKTTASLLIAATFGIHRGGYTLAWDNNETRGTLGWRANQARHHNTAVDLLRDLDRFTDLRSARVGDLDNYVRSQGSAQFDVLASDEDAASAASIDAAAFSRLHHALARFYRVMVIDTGNNMRASNWQAAIAAADQLVIVSTVREDTAQSAAWLVDALRSAGHGDLVDQAVTVLSAPARTADPELKGRLHNHFGQLTRAVLDVPHDPALVAGGPIAYDALAAATRDAWLQVTAAVADGL